MQEFRVPARMQILLLACALSQEGRRTLLSAVNVGGPTPHNCLRTAPPDFLLPLRRASRATYKVNLGLSAQIHVPLTLTSSFVFWFAGLSGTTRVNNRSVNLFKLWKRERGPLGVDGDG